MLNNITLQRTHNDQTVVSSITVVDLRNNWNTVHAELDVQQAKLESKQM
jgi:hypothetical protein